MRLSETWKATTVEISLNFHLDFERTLYSVSSSLCKLKFIQKSKGKTYIKASEINNANLFKTEYSKKQR